MKVWIIRCATGCTCCHYQDHSRGFFQSKEDAEKRVAFFRDPNANNNPVASQYAKKGHYRIEEQDAEEISGNRIIIGDRVHDFTGFAVVASDGSCSDEKEIYY